MAEGKLTLHAIHALLTSGDDETLAIAQRVKKFEASKEDIAKLIDFTKKNGGIEYAEEVMLRMHDEALQFIEKRVGNETIKSSLTTYLNYCIKRTL
jgi:octaprenyl-diphosphate synthase